MTKKSKKSFERQTESLFELNDLDMESIMESDLEDHEIAAELGISLNQVSKIRRELFEE